MRGARQAGGCPGRLAGWSLLLLAAAGLCLACACTRPASEAVRIGTNPWPGYEFLHLAQARGFFRELGLDVRLVELTSNGDVRRAFERGQIDVATATTIDLQSARAHSRRHPQAFYVCDYSNGSDVILAQQWIREVGQLRGHRVGAEPESLDMVHLACALESVGLGLGDVSVLPMAQTDMPEALAGGKVDAVVTYPPVSFKVAREQKVNTVFDSSRIPCVIVDLLMADQDYAVRHRDILWKICLAFDKARRFAAAHPRAALAIMAAREGVSKKEFQKGLAGLTILRQGEQRACLAPGGTLRHSLAVTAAVMRRGGQLQVAADPASLVFDMFSR